MRYSFVGFLLATLAACDLPTEPPAPRLPRQLNDDHPVVVAGRVVNSGMNAALQVANVRVVEAGASVGTDEAGRYEIVLPAKFRGRIVPVNVRTIGFKPVTRMVALTSDTVTVDLEITMDTFFGLTCTLGFTVRTQGNSKN